MAERPPLIAAELKDAPSGTVFQMPERLVPGQNALADCDTPIQVKLDQSH